jgi:type I restriction enzyme, S subunit
MMNQVQLAEICDLVSGQSPPSSSYNQDRDGVPFFQGKADFGELYPRVRYWCTEPKKMSIPGDILFSVRAPVGPTNVNNINACLGRGLCAIRSKDRVIQKYLLHYLRANEHKIAALGTGSTFKAITIKELRSIKIPLPSLEEQKRIAAILDAADELRQKGKSLIARYDDLTQSLFLEMFADPITNPMGWDTVKLENVCQKITDGAHKTPNYQESGVVFLSAKNIKDYVLNCISPKFITQAEHDQLVQRCKVEKDDILITKSGSLGMAAMVEFEFEFSIFESLALLKYSREMINGKFLLYFLNTPSTQHQYAEITKGVGVKHLHLTDLRKLMIILPRAGMQQKFSDLVLAIESQKAVAQESLNKSEDLFNSLLQKAFKGELTN